MRTARRLKLALWGVNLLLGSGNALFAIFYLVPSRIEIPPAPEDEPVRTAPLPDRGDVPFVSNPMRQPSEERKPEPRFTLKGTLCAAFLKSANAELLAFVGGPVLRDGKPFEELRGWTLVELGKDRASFKDGDGKTIDVTLDPARPGEGPVRTTRAGMPYAPGSYKSRLVSSSETRQVWLVDPEEIRWIAENLERILDQEFQVAPYAGGGLRIENVQAGSIGALRGVLAGDILRQINGRPLNTLQEIRALMSDLSLQREGVLRLTLERAGRPMLLEYQPSPR